jgi:hypothetical protein
MTRATAPVALSALTVLAAGTLAAGPAAAATTQVYHEKLSASAVTDQCGITVDLTLRGTHTFQTFVDKAGNVRFQDVAHAVTTMTNVENGKVVHVEASGRDAYGGPGVVNPDGTVTFTDTLTGIDQRVYTSHSSVLLKDAGYLAIVDTVDAEGNLVDEQVIVHGPHEFAGDFAAYCDAITAALR